MNRYIPQDMLGKRSKMQKCAQCSTTCGSYSLYLPVSWSHKTLLGVYNGSGRIHQKMVTILDSVKNGGQKVKWEGILLFILCSFLPFEFLSGVCITFWRSLETSLTQELLNYIILSFSPPWITSRMHFGKHFLGSLPLYHFWRSNSFLV